MGIVSEPPDGVPPGLVPNSVSDRPADPPAPGEDALAGLVALVADDLALCNRTIVAHMHSEVELIPRLAAHIVAAGGKRLRPLLTLASARLCGYPGAGSGGRAT